MKDDDPEEQSTKSPDAKKRRPTKQVTGLTLTGWFIVAASFAIGVVLLFGEMYVGSSNPYISLVSYTFTPAGIGLGFSLIVLSLLLRWRRRRKGIPDRPLPILDLNSRRTHVALMAATLGLVSFVAVSGVATYQAYHFTESTEFCGTVCHEVMQPEYEARLMSPHARVECVECHIGPGADWYVRSKFAGLRQVYAVLTGDYHMPIDTPIANLRPARDTCEQCHWPAKFEGSSERVLWRYWYDRENTPSRFHLLMKVGGVNPATGRPEGIHWHSNSEEEVRYWARDQDRSEIPWVEVVHPDGRRTVYTDGSIESAPNGDEVRSMDCIDCHSRPAHIYQPPNTLVDAALAEGHLDPSVPYLKRNAVQLMSLAYESHEAAEQGITTAIHERYAPMEDVTEAKREEIIATLVELYQRHNYPNQNVSWRTYQSHIGHKTSAGCFRCHGGNHTSDEGETISHDCETCHEFIHQAHGEAAYGDVDYRRTPFEHPGRETEDYETRLCSECHNERVGWYPGNVDDDSIGAVPADYELPDERPHASPDASVEAGLDAGAAE